MQYNNMQEFIMKGSLITKALYHTYWKIDLGIQLIIIVMQGYQFYIIW